MLLFLPSQHISQVQCGLRQDGRCSSSLGSSSWSVIRHIGAEEEPSTSFPSSSVTVSSEGSCRFWQCQRGNAWMPSISDAIGTFSVHYSSCFQGVFSAVAQTGTLSLLSTEVRLLCFRCNRSERMAQDHRWRRRNGVPPCFGWGEKNAAYPTDKLLLNHINLFAFPCTFL